MKFSHVFSDDLETIIAEIESGRPFAFTKFADGERLHIDGVKFHLNKSFEEWHSGENPGFAVRLDEALRGNTDGYHIGISCPCCSDSSGLEHHVPDWEFYRGRLQLPMDRVTYANVFVNGNYPRWREWLTTQRVALISSSKMSPEAFRVPKNAIDVPWDMDGLIDRIAAMEWTVPVCVAAGPAGSIIVHEAWKKSKRDFQLIDVGSTLDPYIHQAMTRYYHRPDHPNLSKVCQWTPKALDKSP